MMLKCPHQIHFLLRLLLSLGKKIDLYLLTLRGKVMLVVISQQVHRWEVACLCLGKLIHFVVLVEQV